MPDDSDVMKYLGCMEEIRRRAGLIQAIVSRQFTAGREDFDAEIIFVQFRKILELIAFGSLTANKKEYSAAYEKFAQHWNAERMLRDLEKVNPQFFPEALEPPQVLPNGHKHFPRPADGFLTKEELVTLYDKCGKVLHARNPFSTESPTVHIGYSVAEWVARIQRLLGWHVVNLVDGDVWVIKIPSDGPVQAFPGTQSPDGADTPE